ncbi:MAG: acyltransferase [Prevotella sp.]|nr:acyltransferase [Prevotella sp.]
MNKISNTIIRLLGIDKSSINNFNDFVFLPFIMSIYSRRIRHFYLRRRMGGLGKNSFVSRNVRFRNIQNIIVGEGCVINPNVLLDGRGGKLVIGNNVDIAQECIIWTMGHDSKTHKAKCGSVTIGDYCWIGCRAMIMPGITIGNSSICAANAVITRDVEPNSIYAGVPAHKISQRNRTANYTLSFNTLFR